MKDSMATSFAAPKPFTPESFTADLLSPLAANHKVTADG